MTATLTSNEYTENNNTPFVGFVYHTAWVIDEYMPISMLTEIFFETDCKLLDDDFEGEYIDYIIPGEEGDIIVHKGDRYPMH